MEEKFQKYVAFDFEYTGLNPWYGNRLTCACAKDSNGMTFKKVDEDEQLIIRSFLEWLQKRNPSEFVLVTKYGKMSDVPFILARLSLGPDKSPRKGLFILDYEHFDLHELTENWVSLSDMARLLKCTPKSDTGLHAITLWDEKRYDELRDYCFQDVKTTEEVYLKYLGLG